MKYMNAKEKYQTLDLQLFADGEGDDGGDPGEGDDQDDEEPDEDGEEEKKFSQKDIDDAVKKRLAREKRKWQREHQKKSSDKDDEKDGNKDNGESEDSKARKVAEERASRAEAKNACYEAGVSKDSVDDVVALARSYMAADEDMDLEEAIEKVVKKYPQFKKGNTDSDDEDEKETKKSWGQRQSGKGSKKMSGVEAKFYELNPDLKE